MVDLVEKRESGCTETCNHCTHTVWYTAEIGQGYLCLRGNEGPTQIHTPRLTGQQLFRLQT